LYKESSRLLIRTRCNLKHAQNWLYVAIFDLWSAAGRRILPRLQIPRGAFSFPWGWCARRRRTFGAAAIGVRAKAEAGGQGRRPRPTQIKIYCTITRLSLVYIDAKTESRYFTR
jgi:hypothetical protein